ncbi:MAG TPA: carboxypeptidase-like regulatory domain-containing protein, partial [Gemmatimonadales bacterium]|nr:carboxypeptidase-like regulatory domain-containing protein [Gemmatimonadales bacterium]
MVLALLLAAPVPLASQTDTTRVLITGTVIDPLRQPIEGVEVRVVGTQQSVLTAAAGTFRLYAPRSKELLLQFRRPGYSAQLLKLDGGWSGTVLLQPGEFRLPEIQVTARYAKPAEYAATAKYDDYFRRKRIGFGEFIDHDEIARRGALETTRLLEGRAGIRVAYPHDEVASGKWIGAIVAFARCNEFPPKVNVYVDGRK